MRNTLSLLASGLLLAGSAVAQTTQYLDVLVVKVKPERRADFDALNKRIVEANRNNQGDTWVALSTEYGENNTVSFISARTDYAAIDKASDAFMGAMNKALGAADAKKALQDFNTMIESSRSELRRRRPDLSMNFPADPAEWAKFIGESRWERVSTVHIRPGRSLEFEAELKRIKDVWEKNSQKITIAVTQGLEGTAGPVYYVTAYGKNLGAFDTVPGLREALGDEGFEHYLKMTSEVVLSSHSELMRFLPELSNAPKEIVAAAPDFWNAKSAEMATAQ
jgi:quinol monooxygenase YgiN